jgi:hypothetical protein
MWSQAMASFQAAAQRAAETGRDTMPTDKEQR